MTATVTITDASRLTLADYLANKDGIRDRVAEALTPAAREALELALVQEAHGTQAVRWPMPAPCTAPPWKPDLRWPWWDPVTVGDEPSDIGSSGVVPLTVGCGAVVPLRRQAP